MIYCGDRLLYRSYSAVYQGFPTAMTLAGISLVTMLPAPIVVLFPIVALGQIISPPLIQTSSPIAIAVSHDANSWLISVIFPLK